MLVQLHRLGVCHNDFSFDNVVVDEKGFPRVIDFGEAGMHSCDTVDRDFKLYENESSRAKLGCEELYESSMEMDLWAPGKSRTIGSLPDPLADLLSSTLPVSWHLRRHVENQDRAGDGRSAARHPRRHA